MGRFLAVDDLNCRPESRLSSYLLKSVKGMLVITLVKDASQW